MNVDWRSFLGAAGAAFTDDKVSHFSGLQNESEAALAGDVVVDLSHLGLIGADGRDVVSFLQGQLTNDIREVCATRAQLSACCTPKGRVLANFLVFSRADGYFLQLPQQLLDSFLKRLRLFVLRSQVTLTNASDALIRIGVSGWNGHAELRHQLGALPSGVDEVVQSAPFTVIRLRGERPRYEIVGPAESMRSIWAALTGVARPAGSGAWSLLDIHCGLPTVLQETADTFVPQMLNWDVLSGISFTKGCYAGQEIVARTQYLGKIKRRLYRAEVKATETVQPTMPLIVVDERGPRSVGQVVNAERQRDNHWDLLAVISTEEAEHETLYLRNAEGPALQLAPLPYMLEPGPSA